MAKRVEDFFKNNENESDYDSEEELPFNDHAHSNEGKTSTEVRKKDTNLALPDGDKQVVFSSNRRRENKLIKNPPGQKSYEMSSLDKSAFVTKGSTTQDANKSNVAK